MEQDREGPGGRLPLATPRAAASTPTGAGGGAGGQQRAGQLVRSLDTSAMTRRHIGLYTISCLGHLFDGYDVQLIGVVLPAITAGLALSPGAAGDLASSAAFGMFFGAIGVGWVTDRRGRKFSLMLALTVFALGSLLSAVAVDYPWLFAFRVLTGVGLGAEVVTMYAYISEFLPTRTRGTLLTTSSFFWQLSSVGAALLGIVVIPSLGWRAMFFIGAAPAVITVLIWRLLPDSVRFLLTRGRQAEAERVVRKLSSVDPDSVALSEEEAQVAARMAGPVERVSTRELFTGRFRRLTIGVWIIQFFNGFVLFSIVTWLPSILVGKGFTFIHSLQYVAVIVTVGASGNIVAGMVLNRFGRRPTMLAFFVAGGALLMLWSVQDSVPGILIVGSAASFFIYGVSGAVYTYTSEVYPTRHRGTGTGWSGGAQRVGGIVAPIIIGHMTGAGWSISSVFYLLAAGFLVAATAVVTATHETGHKTLEEIDAEVSRPGAPAVAGG
jgi:MFS transporter, putative metabolite:H+ symporter